MNNNQNNDFEKELEKLYKDEMNSSAPDMDALWSRIESRIDNSSEKPQAPEKKITFVKIIKIMSLAAACIAAMVAVPKLIGNDEDLLNETVYDNSVYEDVCMEESADGAPPENTIKEEETALDYFVEDDVLAQTECFVDGIVDSVYYSGDDAYYTLTAVDVYGAENPESITVKSSSEYHLEQGGEYLIPLKIKDGEYVTVYDNAPQIKFSEDGSMIYYNGWKSLYSEEDIAVLLDRISENDYFYDRMLSSSDRDISALIEKWNSIKNN